MELQFKSTKCPYLASAICEVASTEVTQEVRLSDGMPDIGRVLASWGQILIRSKEWMQDQVTVSGGLMVWVLYAPDDGTEPRSTDIWIPFQLKWHLHDAPSDGVLRLNPVLRFVDSRGVSARKIMVRAGVAARLEACYATEAAVYEPDELPEDIQTLCNTYPLRLPVEMGEKTFLLDEDLTASADIARILSYTITPILQEKRVAGDKIVMRGTAVLQLVYRCPEGRIRTTEIEIPISQYAQLESSYDSDAAADVLVAVTSLELDQNDGNQLCLKCGMVAQYMISNRILITIAEDAYSPRRKTGLKQEMLQLPAILEQRAETVPVQYQFPGICGEIVDVRAWPDFPGISRSDTCAALALPAVFQLLYYAEDGSLQCASGRWQGNLQLDADAECEIDAFMPQCLNVQAMAGLTDIGLMGKYQMQIDTTSNHGITMITALEMGELEEADPTRPSLILCRTEGESLWAVAKRCGSTVADIQRANDLQEVPKGNQMLLIPVN